MRIKRSSSFELALMPRRSCRVILAKKPIYQVEPRAVLRRERELEPAQECDKARARLCKLLAGDILRA